MTRLAALLVLLVACAATLAAGPAHPAPGSSLAPAPPRPVFPRFAAPPSTTAPVPVAWREPNVALAEARKDRKIVLLDVEVTWSAWCARMQHSTYADPGVRED